MDYFTFYNMLSESVQICKNMNPLLRKCSRDKAQAPAAADSAAARQTAPAPLPETIKTELLGADGLVASGGAAANSQACLAASTQLARTIKKRVAGG